MERCLTFMGWESVLFKYILPKMITSLGWHVSFQSSCLLVCCLGPTVSPEKPARETACFSYVWSPCVLSWCSSPYLDVKNTIKSSDFLYSSPGISVLFPGAAKHGHFLCLTIPRKICPLWEMFTQWPGDHTLSICRRRVIPFINYSVFLLLMCKWWFLQFYTF